VGLGGFKGEKWGQGVGLHIKMVDFHIKWSFSYKNGGIKNGDFTKMRVNAWVWGGLEVEMGPEGRFTYKNGRKMGSGGGFSYKNGRFLYRNGGKMSLGG
jgi:hypothetical protein